MSTSEVTVSEQVQHLAENVHYASGLYFADGVGVIRQHPAEGNNPPAPYQDSCPCCGETFAGITAGIVTPPDEMAPVQRVTWDDGGTSNWPPHLLQHA